MPEPTIPLIPMQTQSKSESLRREWDIASLPTNDGIA